MHADGMLTNNLQEFGEAPLLFACQIFRRNTVTTVDNTNLPAHVITPTNIWLADSVYDHDWTLFLSSGYFNGAEFFQGERTAQKSAAGGMFVIMGFLWLVGIPVLVVAIIMVRIAQDLVTIICVYY